jgi:enamine deaminase RidA (YjgF/YER057c/UK114 family)
MRRTEALLERLGLSCDDTVKINRYYVAGGSAAEWETSARVCASFFSEPGPAATGVPLPALHDDGTMLAVEVTAMRGATDEPLAHHHSWPAGHWDWPTHLPYKHGVRCEDLIFVGGQVSLDTNGHVVDVEDLSAQTRTSMHNIAKVLAGFGASMDDVVKVTTFYQGTANADRLHENFAIRSASFTSPGPATTGVPVPYLAYPGMVIEIQVVAMTGKT